MRRREFISLIGGVAATWPLATRAQQAQMPVVGYLRAATPNEGEPLAAAFRRRYRARPIRAERVTSRRAAPSGPTGGPLWTDR
jgi:hypothetical protein